MFKLLYSIHPTGNIMSLKLLNRSLNNIRKRLTIVSHKAHKSNISLTKYNKLTCKDSSVHIDLFTDSPNSCFLNGSIRVLEFKGFGKVISMLLLEALTDGSNIDGIAPFFSLICVL